MGKTGLLVSMHKVKNGGSLIRASFSIYSALTVIACPGVVAYYHFITIAISNKYLKNRGHLSKQHCLFMVFVAKAAN